MIATTSAGGDEHRRSRHQLRERLERALKAGGRPVDRLGGAETSVTFKISGGEETITLLLDRQPPEVVDGDEPAEITIELVLGRPKSS